MEYGLIYQFAGEVSQKEYEAIEKAVMAVAVRECRDAPEMGYGKGKATVWSGEKGEYDEEPLGFEECGEAIAAALKESGSEAVLRFTVEMVSGDYEYGILSRDGVDCMNVNGMIADRVREKKASLAEAKAA